MNDIYVEKIILSLIKKLSLNSDKFLVIESTKLKIISLLKIFLFDPILNNNNKKFISIITNKIWLVEFEPILIPLLRNLFFETKRIF